MHLGLKLGYGNAHTFFSLGLWGEDVWPGTAGTTRLELGALGRPLDPAMKGMQGWMQVL